MFDRRLLSNFDWGLVILTLLLGSVGIFTLYSAVGAKGGSLYMKQLSWFGIGWVALFFVFIMPYKWLEWGGIWIFVAAVILLVLVFFFGKDVSGSRRWLSMGRISFQPSEFTKIALIAVLARHYAGRADGSRSLSLRELAKPLFWTGIPVLIIVGEPDLGTAIILCLIAASMTIFINVERRLFIRILTIGGFGLSIVWFFLRDYQKGRILTFLNPESDPLGAGYHIIQSKIAIGSGMFTGKGFMSGTQNALSFLPEQHTDFIFCVLAEEWGFLGSMLVLVTFMMFIMWGLNIAFRSKDPLGAILAVGITSMIFWQVFINVAMVMGLMPVVGIPLPFLSYGGSSILTTMIGTGILMNISTRRFLFDQG